MLISGVLLNAIPIYYTSKAKPQDWGLGLNAIMSHNLGEMIALLLHNKDIDFISSICYNNNII